MDNFLLVNSFNSFDNFFNKREGFLKRDFSLFIHKILKRAE